jgi:hypothetical protein
MPQKVASTLRRRPGRPRKFAAPSRAVTVTLPESVFDILRGVDPDVSRAIVRMAERQRPEPARSAAELSVFGRRAVITVRPTPTLERRTGVSLVPLPDGRALMSFDDPTTIEELELLLYDALDDAHLTAEDRRLFQEIGSILKEARRSREVSLLRRNIIVLESPRPLRSMPRRRRRTKA